MKLKTTLATLTLALIVLAGCSTPTGNAVLPDNEITVYKNMNCGCCEGYIAALKAEGYDVTVKSMENLNSIKDQYNIPMNMRSCHTASVGNYFIEGHVPLKAVEKLLTEQPDIDGISLPNMPAGSPGMPGTKTEKWTIYSIKDGEQSEFMVI